MLLKIKIACAILRMSLVINAAKKKSIHLRHWAGQEGQAKVTRDISPTHQYENIKILKRGNNTERK